MEPECVRTPPPSVPWPSEDEEGVAVDGEAEVVMAGHRGLPWWGWVELVSKVKMLGARGVGRDERAAVSLPPFVSPLSSEWAESSDDFRRLDLLARPVLCTGDLERDRDLELE